MKKNYVADSLAFKKTPPPIEEPEKELKKINLKIAKAYEIGRADNETFEQFEKRMAGYYEIKRRCQAQLRNEGDY